MKLCLVVAWYDGSMSQYRRSRGQSSTQKLSLVLIGNCGVGKSSVLSKLVDNSCDVQALNTIGIDFRRKYIEVAGQTLQLQVWDTAGQEKFNSIPSMYCRNADGIILVYDIENGKSFEGISFWLSKLQIYAPPDVQVLLLGNKHDVDEHVVTLKMGEQAAKKIGALFYEVSAKSGYNIQEAFKAFAQLIWTKRHGGPVVEAVQRSVSSGDEEGVVTILEENSTENSEHKAPTRSSPGCCSNTARPRSKQ